MVTSMLRASVLLVILCVAKGQSTTSDSHCSYTFKVPTAECSQAPVKVELLENSIVALQEQMKHLASDNKKLREELATIKAGRLNRVYCGVGGNNRSAVNLKQCSTRSLNDHKEHGLLFSCEFIKRRDDTVLRVVWNGDFRLIHSGPKSGSCRRWFFTING
ncbi:hypothetical protein NP493_941g02039 [Ridgeia piscesae]|uniref:CTHRC1 C-terminal domain-containing protein n=1 Tax=Ridgeia piscesae TaxID=27915 RepID=A0AAD9KK31_RIDPI|nr:hypothetical protein NP493_941g02039 [Ridgeia piscesae]